MSRSKVSDGLEELETAIREAMELTGTSDPAKAVKKLIKKVRGRQTTYSRPVGYLMGILDATKILKELEEEAMEKGYKIALSQLNTNDPVRKKEQEIKLKALDKMDYFFNKMDKIMDLMEIALTNFANSQISSAKKQIEAQRKVKPTFKVEIK